jgi:exopolysaccharide production protein ExoZ
MADGKRVAGSRSRSDRIVFLDYLRSLAVLLVLWDHMVGQWLGWRRSGWLPLDKVDVYVTRPLDLIQDMGWLGVSLFFLISGFIISHVAATETRLEFSVKRLLRIYPPMILAVLVTMLFYVIRHHWQVIDSGVGIVPAVPSWHDALWSMTLVNYEMNPQPIVLGVAWSLVIEVCFYIMVFAIRPLLNYRGYASWTILAAVYVVLETMRHHGPHYFLLGVSISYIPLLVAGQALWLRWSGRVSTLHCAAITLVAWLIWIHGLATIQPTFLTAANSYGPSLLVAYGLFVVLLIRNPQIRSFKVVSFTAARSYSLYLLHAPVGLFVLDVLISHVSFTVALLAAVVAVFLAAEISYRFVELPTQRLGRRMLRRFKRGNGSPTKPMDDVPIVLDTESPSASIPSAASRT